MALRRHRWRRVPRAATPALSNNSEKEGAEFVPLVFINVNSGGKQGKALLPQFEALLPKDQVYDIIKEGGCQRGYVFL